MWVYKLPKLKYGIGLNYSYNHLDFYHRASTPPLNPFIPIFIIKNGDYSIHMLNFLFRYSFKIQKCNIDLFYDNAYPISIINNLDNKAATIFDDIPEFIKLALLNKINITISYPLD